MKLTRQQRRYLEFCKGIHDAPSPNAELTKELLRVGLVGVIVIGVGAITAGFIAVPGFFHFVIGIAAGALASEAGRLLKYRRIWPVIEKVLDWKLVHDLLSQTQTGKSAQPDSAANAG